MKKTLFTTILILAQFSMIPQSFAELATEAAAHDDSVLEKAIDDALNVETPSSETKKAVAVKKTDKEAAQPTVVSQPPTKQTLADVAAPSTAPGITSLPAKKAKAEKVQVITKQVSKNHMLRKLTQEEAAYLQALEMKKDAKSAREGSEVASVVKKSPRSYEPAPTETQEMKHEGFIVERDSSKIVKKRMSYSDALSVKVCFSAGLSLVLDDDIKTELQQVYIDDKIFFDSVSYENHRGVFVKLKTPVPDGKMWESAIRLTRKDNDKSYLVNLIGAPCPHSGTNPFPKVVYIQDKQPGIVGRNSKIMTPEDTIIELSGGLPRRNVNKIDVYDMVARSSSDWAVFGVQIQSNNGKFNPENYTIRMVDNLQIIQVPSKIDYLQLQSEKASQATGISTARYKILVNVDKSYFVENRYLHLMVIDKKSGYYQYVRIDTLPYILKLRERGFDI